jgi:hypothetical protein
MKKIFSLKTLFFISFLLSFSIHSFGGIDCNSYQIKKVGYVVYESSAFTSHSLVIKARHSSSSSITIQWRIPDESDLSIIKQCPQIRNRLTKDVYYWSQIKVGLFYKCFKINQETSEMEFEKRLSTDGAYGVLIGKVKDSLPPPHCFDGQRNKHSNSSFFRFKQKYRRGRRGFQWS